MTIAPINTAAQLAKPANAAPVRANDALDQASFLKLMTTQLQTQDPFDPVDNTEMVAQMAQFSNVSGIAEMNASLKKISADIASSRIGDAASWIGRAALVASKVAAPVDGVYAGEVVLPSAATGVTLDLVDAAGQVVHSQSFGPQPAGGVPFAWDGAAAGVTGPLHLVASAADAKGAVAATTSSWTTIAGVQSPAGGAPKLVTPLGLLAPADALRLG